MGPTGQDGDRLQSVPPNELRGQLQTGPEVEKGDGLKSVPESANGSEAKDESTAE